MGDDGETKVKFKTDKIWLSLILCLCLASCDTGHTGLTLTEGIVKEKIHRKAYADPIVATFHEAVWYLVIEDKGRKQTFSVTEEAYKKTRVGEFVRVRDVIKVQD